MTEIEKQLLTQIFGPEHSEQSVRHMSEQFAFALYIRISGYTSKAADLMPISAFVQHCLTSGYYERARNWEQSSFQAMTAYTLMLALEAVQSYFAKTTEAYPLEAVELIQDIAGGIVLLSLQPMSKAPRSLLIEIKGANGPMYRGVALDESGSEVEFFDLEADPASFLEYQRELEKSLLTSINGEE